MKIGGFWCALRSFGILLRIVGYFGNELRFENLPNTFGDPNYDTFDGFTNRTTAT